MQLNLNCMRAILLHIAEANTLQVSESNIPKWASIRVTDLYQSLSDYTKEEIYYAIFMLDEAELIDTISMGTSKQIVSILRLTFDGHEFLNGIHDDRQWSIMKKALASIRNYSLDAISAIAKGVTASLVPTAIEAVSPDLLDAFFK